MDTTVPSRETVAFEVRRIIAETIHMPVDAIDLADTLDEPRLGVDSLSLIKLNVVLEERFDITIPDFVTPEVVVTRSVADVVALVIAGLDAREGGAS